MKLLITTVVWADAAGGVRQGWRPVHEAIADSGTVHCVSTGYVIKENKKTVTLASHCVIDNSAVQQVDGEISIPKGWIVSRKTFSVDVPANEHES